jgi:hypothetical protein
LIFQFALINYNPIDNLSLRPMKERFHETYRLFGRPVRGIGRVAVDRRSARLPVELWPATVLHPDGVQRALRRNHSLRRDHVLLRQHE